MNPSMRPLGDTSIYITESTLIPSLPTTNVSDHSLFASPVNRAKQQLINFAASDNALTELSSIFQTTALASLDIVLENWVMGNFGDLPSIEVLTDQNMGGAQGAFATENNTIYLAESAVQAGIQTDPLMGLVGTIIEEVGHYVDALVNPDRDTPGDEGALFKAAVLGYELTAAEKIDILNEDDSGTVTVNGKVIEVEQATVKGNAWNNTLSGTNYADSIYGYSGHDIAYGYNGNDKIYGHQGNDKLYGGYGNDFLDGGYGFDYIQGGGGIDTVSYAFYNGAVTANVKRTSGNVSFPGNSSLTETVIGVENYIGSSGTDTVYGNYLNNAIQGKNGNDRLYGDAGNDYLDGGYGFDYINGGSGIDTVSYAFYNGAVTINFKKTSGNVSFPGNSILTETVVGVENYTGSSGGDTVYGNYINNVIRGNNGYDKLYGDSGHDRLFGGNHNDRLYGGSGNDALYGENNNDVLVGNSGNDYLNGGYGNDYLTAYGHGLYERDSLVGGGGYDTFALGSASATYYAKKGGSDYAKIIDFNRYTDKIQLQKLSNVASNASNAYGYKLQSYNGNTWIRRASDNEAIAFIQGQTGLSLTSRQFSFLGTPPSPPPTTVIESNPSIVDLVVQGASVPTVITTGNSVSISAYVKNQGNKISNPSHLRYWLSNDTTLNKTQDRALGVDYVTSLGTGISSSKETHSFTYDASWGTGRKYILFEADGYNAVSESNESNNIVAKAITINTPKPDLKKYWFYYNFNPDNYKAADSYEGSVIAPAGKYQVGRIYDYANKNTELGRNGSYSIYKVEEYNDNLTNEAGRVFVNKYFDRDNGGTKEIVPQKYYNNGRNPLPAGTSYLGSEQDHIDVSKSSTSYFGRDYYEADPPVKPKDIDIRLDFYGNFSQYEKDAINQAAKNWESIITKDKVASGVLQIAITQGYKTMQGENWGHWAEAIWTPYDSQRNLRLDLTTSSGSYGNYVGQNRIHFSTSAMNTISRNLLVRLAMHEIGHTLGLNDAQYDASLGFDGIMDLKYPGGLDQKITDGIYNRLEWFGYGVNRNAYINWY